MFTLIFRQILAVFLLSSVLASLGAIAQDWPNKPIRLVINFAPVPVWALQAGGSLLGKGDSVKRLCGNLQVDISKACSLLGWVPPLSVNEGLRRTMSCRIKIKR